MPVILESQLLRTHYGMVITNLVTLQLIGARGLATVNDAPLNKKVEMTNWEKASSWFTLNLG
jgi:hypothetical protein